MCQPPIMDPLGRSARSATVAGLVVQSLSGVHQFLGLGGPALPPACPRCAGVAGQRVHPHKRSCIEHRVGRAILAHLPWGAKEPDDPVGRGDHPMNRWYLQMALVVYLYLTPSPGMHWKGGGYPPPPLQGAQPMPSHCLPDGKSQPQRHL